MRLGSLNKIFEDGITAAQVSNALPSLSLFVPLKRTCQKIPYAFPPCASSNFASSRISLLGYWPRSCLFLQLLICFGKDFVQRGDDGIRQGVHEGRGQDLAHLVARLRIHGWFAEFDPLVCVVAVE
jgi:hypothetical protein